MKRYLIILFAATLAALSCTKEEPIGQGSGSDGKVQFTITVPGSGIPTRGEVTQGSDADTRINNLLLLLFDNKSDVKYVGHTVPTQIERGDENSTGAYLVTAELPINGEHLVVAIANWRGTNSEVETAIAKIETDNNLLNKDNPKKFNDVVPLFDYPHYTNLPDKDKGFVMSGSNVFTQTSRPEIELRRTVAKLNITVAKTAPNDELVDTGLGITQFLIEEVHIQNLKANVRPITMNDNSLYIAAGNAYPTYKYTIATKDSRAIKDQIFLSETAYNPDAAIADRLNVLIKANLGTELGSRWFRLDINDENVEGTFAGIVRNNRYEMTITSVNNVGYELKAEAEGAPTNVVSTITVSDDGNTQYDHIVWNGSYYLAATSVPEFEPWEFANEVNDQQRHDLGYKIDIKSNIKADYSSSKYQIQIEDYPEWLGGIKASDNNSGALMIEIAPLSRNDGPDAERREGVIVIKAGPMTLEVPVVQKVGGILAPPGVLGVGVESGRLTLRGSREYNSVGVSFFPNFSAENFGGLAKETVYVAYFKHGSLIATSSAGRGAFDPERDVVWRPEQFRGNIASWSDIPTGSPNGIWPATDDLAKGTGDPCRLADGSKGRWTVPTGLYSPQNISAYWGNQKISDFRGRIDLLDEINVEGIYNNTSSPDGVYDTFSPDTRRRNKEGKMSEYPDNTITATNRGFYWVSEAGYMQVSTDAKKTTADATRTNVFIQSAAAIRCVYAPPAANIIYWDATSQTMQLGNWNRGDGGVVTQENMLFFQFGSTIGFTAMYDSWDNTDIKFNLSSDTNYTSLNNWRNWHSVGGGSVQYAPEKQLVDGFISSSAYHYADNVWEGRGDPCKLVGLTKEQVEGGMIDNGLWVMPTLAQLQDDEWKVHTGYGPYPTYYTENAPAGARNKEGQFLPAAGGRKDNGGPSRTGLEGCYWTNKPTTAIEGSSLYFQNNEVNMANINDARFGLGVRCVPAPPAPPAPAEPYILYMASDGKLSVGQWGDDVNAQNILYTKFGSVVAMKGSTNGATFLNADIKFNPTSQTFGSGSTGYNKIPYTGDPTSTYDQIPISGTQIKAGRGDICRLVGIKAGEVATMSSAALEIHMTNSDFRLPTINETAAFAPNQLTASSTHWMQSHGTNGGSFGGLFLPALGKRDHEPSTLGQMQDVGTVGYYWTSDTWVTVGAALCFNNKYIYSKHFNISEGDDSRQQEASALTVRCVRR